MREPAGLHRVHGASESWGETAMHLAAANQDAEAVRCLLDGGASVEAEDNDGWSPLHRLVSTTAARDCLALMLQQLVPPAPTIGTIRVSTGEALEDYPDTEV